MKKSPCETIREKKLYSVLLLYPDGLADYKAGRYSGAPTYFHHTKAETPLRAVAYARMAAQRANEGEFAGNDFEPLLVIEGHHENQL